MGRLANPFIQLANSSSQVLAGSSWLFTLSGTDTETDQVFHDLANTIIRENPVIADASGTLPADLYLSDTITYRVRVTLADGSNWNVADNVISIVEPAATETVNTWIGSDEMITRSTGGASAGSTNGTADTYITLDVFVFAQLVDTSVQTNLTMPDNWDGGSIITEVVWETSSTELNDVAWNVGFKVFRNGSDLNDGDTWSYAGTVETSAGVNHLNKSSLITFTPNGVANDWIVIDIQRNGAATEDTLTGIANLIGINITYGVI